MPKYRVYVTATASSSLVVEAASKEEAEEKAYQSEDFPTGSLCHQCAHHMDLGEFEVGNDEGDIELIEEN